MSHVAFHLLKLPIEQSKKLVRNWKHMTLMSVRQDPNLKMIAVSQHTVDTLTNRNQI